MTNLVQSQATAAQQRQASMFNVRLLSMSVLLMIVVGLFTWLTITINNFTNDDDYFLDTTVGQLAIWMADQSEEDEPESVLGRYAQSRRINEETERLDEAILLNEMKTLLVIYSVVLTGLATLGGVGMVFNWRRHRFTLAAALIGVNLLMFIFPITSENNIVAAILACVTLLSFVILFFSQHVERVVGFLVILSLFTVFWEGGKAIASELDYRLSAPTPSLDYSTYSTLDDALQAVNSGEIDVFFGNHRDLEGLVTPFPTEEDSEQPDSTAYPELRYVRDFERSTSQWGFPIEPTLPGRISLIVKADRAASITNLSQAADLRIGTEANSTAEEDYLAQTHEIIFVDLSIANNINLPHLQNIAEALLQPARRNGPLLLVRILFDAALYTWTEAALGFVIGGLFGFVLGSVFAHVPLIQRSLLPYVIASQTIPIIALAPMIVIWLRDTHPLIPVAVISSYLTFFPVTINTLRGLQSPDPRAFDLMQSYAASRWQIMWKLRFPAALPFIFTALKVSATASVVGAIIGELPSGIRDGLGRAILNFSSDYSLISTPKLWGAIFMAALVGILFFLIVTVVEQVIVRGNNAQEGT